MKSTVFLATFALLSLIEIINGQQNGFVYNENWETESPKSMQQPVFTYAITQTIRDFWNQNENTAALPNNVNQETLMQTNNLPSSVSTQQIQLPPDLQQQPLQVQQYLQLQKPLQLQPSPLQQAQQLQPQMQHLLQKQPDAPLSALQSQDFIQLQSPIEKQPQLQLDPSHRPVQTSQTLQFQKPLLQQTPQSLEDFQQQQALQQRLGLQQISSQNHLTIPESKPLVDTSLVQLINNNQPNSQIKIKWQTSNPVAAMNVENPYNTQNLNIQPLYTSINPVENIANGKPQEISSLRYGLSQPPAAPTISAASTPLISSSPFVATQPTNYIKSFQESYVPLTAPYNYIYNLPNQGIPNKPNKGANTKLRYYDQATDSKQNTYINNNFGLRYPEQSQLPVAIQNQPTTLVPTQASVPSSIPISMVQPPMISPQYGVPASYPGGTIVAPAYARQKSISSNLKSIMPLVIQLLKEKITRSGCNNDCPCECKNDSSDNELEVASGYTSRKDYGLIDRDPLPVLDTVSEEEQGPECLRETKDCEEYKNVSLDTSDEILEEEEGSAEEEVDEDEDS